MVDPLAMNLGPGIEAARHRGVHRLFDDRLPGILGTCREYEQSISVIFDIHLVNSRRVLLAPPYGWTRSCVRFHSAGIVRRRVDHPARPLFIFYRAMDREDAPPY
jgi:hypothetical protein